MRQGWLRKAKWKPADSTSSAASKQAVNRGLQAPAQYSMINKESKQGVSRKEGSPQNEPSLKTVGEDGMQQLVA